MITNYAGFWLRFVAWFIDVILLGIIAWVIIAPILATVGFVSHFSFSDFQNTEDIASLIAILSAMIGISWAANEVIKVLYHSFILSGLLHLKKMPPQALQSICCYLFFSLLIHLIFSFMYQAFVFQLSIVASHTCAISPEVGKTASPNDDYC